MADDYDDDSQALSADDVDSFNAAVARASDMRASKLKHFDERPLSSANNELSSSFQFTEVDKFLLVLVVVLMCQQKNNFYRAS